MTYGVYNHNLCPDYLATSHWITLYTMKYLLLWCCPCFCSENTGILYDTGVDRGMNLVTLGSKMDAAASETPQKFPTQIPLESNYDNNPAQSDEVPSKGCCWWPWTWTEKLYPWNFDVDQRFPSFFIVVHIGEQGMLETLLGSSERKAWIRHTLLDSYNDLPLSLYNRFNHRIFHSKFVASTVNGEAYGNRLRWPSADWSWWFTAGTGGRNLAINPIVQLKPKLK
jgi:hypothetical protein